MVSNVVIVTDAERGRRFREQNASMFNCVEIFIAEFASIIGARAGSGVIGNTFDVED